MNELGFDFFERETSLVARELIGKILVRELGNERMACRIVESEAYLPVGDSACHASIKKTNRNEAMFESAGTIYVYSIHARYCVNIVTEPKEVGAAVLIRAGMPVEGLELMQKRRSVGREQDLLSGPAKMCQALEIDKRLNGKSLGKPSGLRIFEDQFQLNKTEIKVTPRIGVTSAHEKLLRYVWGGCEFASGPKYLR